MSGTELGRALIAVEGALRKLGFRDEAERKAFVDRYCKSVDKDLRHQLLTFRVNRVSSEDNQSTPTEGTNADS
jgi:hypothetical protein